MPSASDYLENAWLNHVLNHVSMPSPASVYISLHSQDPTDAGTGQEVSGGGYARTQVTAGFSGAFGVVSNTSGISFPTPIAPWGTVTHCGIWDTASGGNLLSHAAMETARAVGTGANVRFLANQLQVSIAEGTASNYLREALAKHVLVNEAMPSPASVHLALYASDPGPSDTGQEISGGGYARTQIAAGFAGIANGAATNSAPIIFATATASWGLVTHFGIRDAASGGNLLFYGELTQQSVLSGEIFSIGTSGLRVSMS